MKLVLIIALFGFLFAWYIGFFLQPISMLHSYHQEIVQYVVMYPKASAAAFILLYCMVIALSVPLGAILSMVGGFFFAQPWATLYVVIGATLGAFVLFSLAKSTLGGWCRTKVGDKWIVLENNVAKYGVWYLLFVRLVPLFPFWFVNIACALLQISWKRFLWTTAIGIIPGAFVFTQIGNGMGSLLEVNQETARSVWTWQLQVALWLLGILVLLPVLLRRKNL